MQHVPTLIVVVLRCSLVNRSGISGVSFTLITVFLYLHSLGGRDLYSYTP